MTNFVEIIKSFTVQKQRAIDVQLLKTICSYTGENIAKAIAIVSDNVTNMKSTASILKMIHLSCFARTLNLLVQGAIASSILSIVDKVKSIVQYFKISSLYGT